MKRSRTLKHIALTFALVLFGYIGVFSWIEHRRVVKGPWTVTFSTEAGVPALIVNQPKLGIRDVRIVFPEEATGSNATQTMKFSGARVAPFDVPYGKCVFYDPLFLPGTVTFDLFGHEVQLLPRVLTVDKAEHPWRSGATIQLNKPTTTP